MLNKIWNVILCIGLFSMILFACMYFSERTGVYAYISKTDVMQPIFGKGSVVFIDIKHQEANLVDIVLYRNYDDTLACRRAVNFDKIGGYVLLGDNEDLQTQSHSVMPEQIVGIYLFAIPYVGYYVKFGFILAIIAVIGKIILKILKK